MARKRLSKDVLTLALDFCDERGFRFGQFMFNVVRDAITHSNFTGPTDRQCACAMFNAENDQLEEWITNFIYKSVRRREVLDTLAKAEMKDGTYDIGACTRAAGHEGPCNGFPAGSCPVAQKSISRGL